MSKKLVWKAFETFEEMEEYGKSFYANLTPAQRVERFFALLAVRWALGANPKQVDPNSVILRKRNDHTS